MKTNIIIFCTCFILFACNDYPIGQQPVDAIKPGKVTNVTWVATPGGANVFYTLPPDEDLLYVKAVFERKPGEISETKASVYTDTLKVVGFGDMDPRMIKVIAVDRSRNESDPEIITITPAEPAIIGIHKSLTMENDFGGFNTYWQNPSKAEIGVVFLEKDSIEGFIPFETYYSSSISPKVPTRGLVPEPISVGVYVQDRWGNHSDTSYFELEPLYETLFDRLQFQGVTLPGDESPNAVGNWELYKIWDGVKGGENGYSSPGGMGRWPQSITIDLGVFGKISRIRIYQRNVSIYVWGAGNLRKFEVWGSPTLDASGNWDSWTKLMECQSIKPSGLPAGQNSDEDLYIAANGEDFYSEASNPEVRYIRIKVTQTWEGGDNFQINELEVFGDNRK